MTLNISVPNSTQELRPKITVVGVGGAGGNAVNNMINANLEGVDFLVANTDGQALAASLAERKIQLGRQQTQGLGAGSKPEIGRIAADESIDDILAELADSHMVFITAGMGGGTGTGAAPVIAKACRERGILTVGVITKPFDFEGQGRMVQANAGIEEMQAYVDTLIIIPNQNLFRLANERTTFADAFAMADEVLHQGVCGITDLMIKPGTINLDFADIRSVMAEMGKAMMGTGEASGDNRATNAAEAAINNPLLDETSMRGAQAVLINITGGTDMTLFEVDEAANHIRREVDSDATIIFGSALDEKMDGIMRVSVVATGIAAGSASEKPPVGMTTPMVRQITKAQKDAPAAAANTATAAAVDSPSAGTGADEPPAPAEVPEAVAEIGERDAEPAAETAMEAGDSEAADVGSEPFSFSPASPAMEEEPPAPEAEAEAYFSDDPNQSDLMDIVDAGEDGAADGTDGYDKDEPFIPGETTEPGGEASPAESQGGLTKYLARVFHRGPSKPEEPGVAQDQKEPVLTEAGPEAEAPAGEGIPAAEADAGPGEPMEPPAESPAEPIPLRREAQMGPEAQEVAEAPEAPAAEGDKGGGLAGLNPTPQERLEVDKPAEDIDLEIPAFLRRQAN